MQFLKKHFEKIILSVVVLALGAAAYWLFTAVNQAKEDSTVPAAPVAAGGGRGKPAKGYTPVDLSGLQASLKNLKDVPEFSLTGEHNLFNPVIWKMRPGGLLFKMTVGGSAGLTVTKIVPFFSSYHLDSQAGEGFWIIYTPANERRGSKDFAKPGDKPTAKRAYMVVSVTTNANEPLTLQLKLPGRDDTVPLTADKDFQEVEGYFADFDYKGSDESKSFKNQKVGETMSLSGELYKIIAITHNSVTVQDTHTQQRSIKDWAGH